MIPKYTYPLSLIIFLIFPVLLYSQASIQGKIVDSESKQAVPFATIKLKNNSIGVVSNVEGDFQIPASYKLLQDSLVISCIGYSNTVLDMNQLLDNQLNIIQLQPSVYQLNEAVVSAKGKLSVYKILRMALKNIPLNYPQQPFSYIAYYRDYQIKEKKYLNFNEGIVEIFDKGFSTIDRLSTNIKLYEYRQNKEFEQDSTTAMAYDNKHQKYIPNAVLFSFGGNELSILRLHDAIRNYTEDSYSFVHRLSKDFLKNHTFELQESVTLNDVPLYKISFQSVPAVSGEHHVAEGKIFIEHENFSIHKLEYVAYEKNRQEKKILYDIQVEYARINSFMRLNYISFNNFFKTSVPAKFFVENVHIRQDRNAFVIQVNHPLDTTSAYRKDNYKILFEGKKMHIKAIEIPFDKQIWVFMDEIELKKILEDPKKWTPKIQFSYHGIMDKEGNELNKPILEDVNQFRELFLQKVNNTTDLTDSFYIHNNVPLSLNPLTPTNTEHSTYWMNTPLKSTAY